ncbi:MAG: hypothetical protein ACOX50_04715 [Patescibacteria group bacterium]|jgi:hypothetical protein
MSNPKEEPKKKEWWQGTNYVPPARISSLPAPKVRHYTVVPEKEKKGQEGDKK